MTHDPKARTEISLGLFYADGVPYERCDEIAGSILIALTAAGLRVVPVEPTEEDVERVVRAILYTAICDADGNVENRDFVVRAAIRAFLQGGGDE
jgi:hypothetical protein